MVGHNADGVVVEVIMGIERQYVQLAIDHALAFEVYIAQGTENAEMSVYASIDVVHETTAETLDKCHGSPLCVDVQLYLAG